jgi:hypothetical protein
MADLIECTFDGRAFVPRTAFMLRRANERFGEGEIIAVSAEKERSMRSHRHFFATLADLWSNLHERFALEPWAQSPEHLRKYALIRTGYCDTITHACTTAAEAQRWAAIVRPLDAYSIVQARGSVVERYVAKSQSVKVMGSKVFAESKDAVLRFVEGELLGVAA